MKKKRNFKHRDIQKKTANIDIENNSNVNNEIEDSYDDDNSNVEYTEDINDFDDDMAERLSYYESVVIDDDDEIKEFLSRDYDVVAESRRRVNQPGKRKFSDDKSEDEKAKKEPNFISALWEKWLTVFHDNTFKILYGALAVLAVILVITIAIILTGEDTGTKDSDKETKTQSTEDSTQQSTETPTETQTSLEDTIVPESKDSEIHKLITSYIDAAYLKADIRLVKNYVDDTTNINVEEYKNRKKYIESYENIQCYKFDYNQSNTYIVAVTYDEKIYNIKTAAPSATVFVVKYNSVDKKYYIHNLTESEQLDVFIASRAQEINIISAGVKERLEAAKAADAELKAVLDIMENIANKQQETSTTGN